MKGWTGLAAGLPLLLLTAAAAWGATPAASLEASRAVLTSDDEERDEDEPPILQCVPYARQVSGIQIFGDAWTWWDQADGRYERGYRPRVGAVMSFRPYGNMRLGHVAAVSRIIDSRTVLLRHANWSIIDGRRGQIEDNVRAVDVSPNNDWSEVRVWFAPLQGLGTTHWPLNGFIYPQKAKAGTKPLAPRTVIASTTPTPAASPARTASASVRIASATPSRIGPDFLRGIRPEVPLGRTAPTTRQLAATTPPRAAAAPAARQAQPQRPARPAAVRSDDPIGRIIAGRAR